MPELNVSRKSINDLLSSLQPKKFIIPDYQRPYQWDNEKCDILWNDIYDFYVERKNDREEYFLGTIVTYKETNDDNPQIIDGQQRITTFFLLLRALYTQLDGMLQSDEVQGLKRTIAPCIWDEDNITRVVNDKTQFHIITKVATDEDKDKLSTILETGITESTWDDNYSQNYNFFKKKWEELSVRETLNWKQFVVTFLRNCIILPIECDTDETALRIFSTLNDRGLPLSDSDIFKAQLYQNCSSREDKNDFVESWKELSNITQKANLSLDDIFRYNTHIIRSQNNIAAKEIGLRKFYAEERFVKLKSSDVMNNLKVIAEFWAYLNSGYSTNENNFNEIIGIQAKKFIHCLNHYPNDYWKYATTVYYFNNMRDPNFKNNFEIFLKKLVSYLFYKFLEYPTVNSIKEPIFKMCIDIYNKKELKNLVQLDNVKLKELIINGHNSKISRALILLDAYINSEQEDLIPQKFDVEHILPIRWQNNNYRGWSESDAKVYLERFGNKVVIEKKLNIQAGNGYFGQKKQKYEKSKIANIIELSKLESNDWSIEDIQNREEKFLNRISEFLISNIN